VIAYRATLDVPRELAQFVAKLLLAERGRRGTPEASRALTCFWQAVLGLRWARRRRTGAHHRQPQQDRRHCPRRTRPHPFRARLHQMKIAEITSLDSDRSCYVFRSRPYHVSVLFTMMWPRAGLSLRI
jgi:choline dehydrogenase-like flavoprotein